MHKLMTAILMSAALLLAGQGSSPAAKQLQSAINKEVVEGDLKGAIEIYRKLAQNSDRAVAAQALLRMGQCYEKLGAAQAREAQKAYERIVRDYQDQKEVVAEAQKYLAGMASLSGAGMVETRFAWAPTGEIGGLSDDGRYLLCINWGYREAGLSLHDLGNDSDREFLRLPYATGGLEWAVLSPDGSRSVYGWHTKGVGELRVISVNGSGLRTLFRGEEGQHLDPLAWSPDGKHIIVCIVQPGLASSDLAVFSVADASMKRVKSGSPVGFNGASFSPDGRYVAYCLSNNSGIYSISVDGSREAPLVQSPAKDSMPLWTPAGRVLFVSDRSGTKDLWSIGVADGKPQGQPELLKKNVTGQSIALARDGSYYYTTTENQHDIYVADLDPSSSKIVSQPTRVNNRYIGSSMGPIAWSPDGSFLLHTRQAPNLPAPFVIRSMSTGAEREIPSNHPSGYAAWLPDGRSFVVLGGSGVQGKIRLRQIDVRTGELQSNVEIPATKPAESVLSPDGRTLYYPRREDDGKGQVIDLLLQRDVELGADKELYRAQKEAAGSPLALSSLSVSPDGRHVAFLDVSNRRVRLMVVPVDGGAARTLREYAPEGFAAKMLAWTPDGRNVLCVVNGAGGRQIWIYPLSGSAPMPTGPVFPGVLSNLCVSPDGRHIAFAGMVFKSELWGIKNLLVPNAKSAGQVR